MKKRVLQLLSYVLVAALATMITLAWTQQVNSFTKPEQLENSYTEQEQLENNDTKLEQLEQLIDERYIGEVNLTELEDAAAAAMVAATGDRWGYYIPADEYAAYVEQMENAYVGIGITIRVLEENIGFEITKVNEGGPAQEAGLQVGDIIVAIEGQSCEGMPTTEAKNLVRGEEGTQVELTISRNGTQQTLLVTRRQVQTPVTEAEMLPGGVGLVTIFNFDSRCAAETIADIESLMEQGAQKLILDVRYNPGGYARELVALLDYLLPEGKLLHTVDYEGNEDFDYSDAACLDLPMAVLVNADSYSAAEFFAAALSEYDAAIVVGEQTSGKGHFQTNYLLNDGSAVNMSIGKYFTPSGLSLEGMGVTPDVPVSVEEEMYLDIYYGNLEAADDPQIQAALEALQ